MIKNIHQWEKAIVEMLNLDGWQLTHTGKGNLSWDAIGKTPNGNDCVIEMKFRKTYYEDKMLEKFKYDKLIATGKVALYFVNDPKGNYLFWLNDLQQLNEVEMLCPDTTLWTKKKIKKPCYLINEKYATVININS